MGISSFLVVLCVVIAIIVLKNRRGAQPSKLGRVSVTTTRRESESTVEPAWNHNKPPIPNGHQIYSKNLEVAGSHHQRDNVYRLAVAPSPTLSWAKEPTNDHDVNAISINGHANGQTFPDGYVDKQTAAFLVIWPEFDELSIRFEKAGYRDNWVTLTYQITGPKGLKTEFLEASSK